VSLWRRIWLLRRAEFRIKAFSNKGNRLERELIKKVSEIISRVNLMFKTGSFPKEYINELGNAGQEFDLIKYTFAAEHRELNINSSQSLNSKEYAIWVSKEKEPIFADSKEKCDFIVYALSKAAPAPKKGESIEILIPRSNTLVTKILEMYKLDLKGLECQQIELLEQEINDIVYRLYDVDCGKDVIDKFLKKFSKKADIKFENDIHKSLDSY
jgi:hypothetical protein